MKHSSNIFSYMAKHLTEHHFGKIQSFLSTWIFSDKGYTNPSGVFIKPRQSQDGRMMSLVYKLGVRCPGPPGDYPQNDSGTYSVPMSVCRKCPHHIKAERGRPYACCTVLREIRRAEKPLEESMREMVQSAVEKAKDICENEL